MKKVISLVLTAVILLCCVCFAGCNSEEEDSKSEIILEQLKNEGFSNAYIDESSNKKVFVDSDTCIYISTPSGKNFFIICDLKKDSDIKGILNVFKIFFDTDTSYYDGNYIFNKIQEEVKNIKRASNDGIGYISENGYSCDIFMDGSLTYIDTIYLREK